MSIPMAPAPRLSVIVVSYNTVDLTVESLLALPAAVGDLTYEVIIVDNASTDDSVSRISVLFPEHRVIANPDNLGFARAVNQALEVVRGDVVMLLNPDCMLSAGAAERLVRLLSGEQSIGIAAPMITHPNERLEVLSAGFLPTASRLAVHSFGLSRLSAWGWRPKGVNLIARYGKQVTQEVEWVSGACLVARRSLLEDLGGLSTRWFMYAEDMDLCARARDRGWLVVHCPEATATHIVGASSGGRSKLWIESMEDFYRLRYCPSGAQLAIWRASLGTGLLARGLLYQIRAMRDRERAQMWRSESTSFLRFGLYAIGIGRQGS